MGQTVVSARFVLRGYLCSGRTESASKSPTSLSCDTLATIKYIYSMKNYSTVILTILLTAICSANSDAQSIQFEQLVPIPPASPLIAKFDNVRQADIAFADIDGDNDLDVLLAGFESSNLVTTKLYENQGNGNYNLKSGTPFTGVEDGSIEFADIDGDNDQDVMITGLFISSSRIQIVTELYTNDGNGNFTLVTNTPFTNVYLSSIAFADVDGDNDQDLLITGLDGSNQLVTELYRNDGIGNYTLVSGTTFDAVIESDVRFFDSDGDSDLDLLITGNTGTSTSFPRVSKLYQNNGSGIFTLVSGTPFTGVSNPSIAVADVDGDSDLDIVIAGQDLSGLRATKLYQNNGSNNFSLVAGTPFVGVKDCSIAFSDVDGDNDPDLVITGETAPNQAAAELYLNNGSGAFTHVLNTSFIDTRHSAISFADVDIDGDQDLLMTGTAGSRLYDNNNAGNFTLVTSTTFPDQAISKVTFADIDNDNDQDLLIASAAAVNFYNNDGVGNFTLSSNPAIPGISEGDAAFADVDNDNDLDLLITGRQGSTRIANLYLNDGTGNYTMVSGTPFTGVDFSSLAFADVDGDNDQDVVISGSLGSGPNSTFTALYLNNGFGSFSLVTGTPFEEVERSAIAFADVDGDNDQDVVIAGRNNFGQRTSKLYQNNGSGSFTLMTSTPFSGIEDGSISFGDIDNDNDQDILFTGFSGGGPRLYTNNGSGVFTAVPGNPLPTIVGSDAFFFDVDNDNDPDVLMSGYTGNYLSRLYLNDGNGIFYNVNGLPFEGVRKSTVAYADIDGDNNLDVMIAGIYISVATSANLYRNLSCTPTTLYNDTVRVNGDTLVASNSTASYQWLDCNSNYAIINNATQQSFNPSSSGNYAVELTTGSGCKDTSACMPITIVGLDDLSTNFSFQVYPNPSKKLVTIDFGATENQVELSLFDLMGKRYFNKNYKSLTKMDIELPSNSGIYFLRISTSNDERVIKLFKE